MITTFIIFNTVVIGLGCEPYIHQQYGQLIEVLNYVFLAVFTVEILIKWRHGFSRFWLGDDRVWNWFDFAIVLVGYSGWILSDIFSVKFTGTRFLRVLRVLRSLRSLRLVGQNQKLIVIMSTIAASVVDMIGIISITFIFIFIFAVVGVVSFGEIMPDYFGNFFKAMLTLFISLTQDGWAVIFYEMETVYQRSG